MKIRGINGMKLVKLIIVVFTCFFFTTSCDYIEQEDYEYSEIETLNISGSTNVAANSINSYYTYYLEDADYVWTIPEGATIKSGQGTSQISVLFGDTGGTLSVEAKGMSAEVEITIN